MSPTVGVCMGLIIIAQALIIFVNLTDRKTARRRLSRVNARIYHAYCKCRTNPSPLINDRLARSFGLLWVQIQEILTEF